MSRPKTPEQRIRRKERRAAQRLAKKQGREFSETHCNKCGRPLSDPESIQRGFGPTCWAKITAHRDPLTGEFPLAEEALRNTDPEKAKCICGHDLRNEAVRGYEHDAGWQTDHGKQWLFVKCPMCGYDMALWKWDSEGNKTSAPRSESNVKNLES